MRFPRVTVEQEVQIVRAAPIFKDWVGEEEPDEDRERAVRRQALLRVWTVNGMDICVQSQVLERLGTQG